MSKNKKDDAGPAFPAQGIGSVEDAPGMTMRDYFAAAALQGMMLRNDAFGNAEARQSTAKWAYEFADAMIAARKP